MRLAFMGSPAFAVPALLALHGAGHQIVAVYTQRPRPANRGHAVTRCAVHETALGLGLMVRTPERLRTDEAVQADFAALGLEAAVVAAYGLILPPPMLAAPSRGCLNIHASLLPRWRGAAPIQRAMLAGDARTGVTIMRMEQGLDTGPMLLHEAVPIGPHDTQPMVQDRLAAIGAALILRALDENPRAIPQPETGVTYAAKLTKADGALDFTRPAADLARQVRALKPWPGTFADFGGETLKVLEAEVVTSQNPSPAFREREGPAAKRWEGEGLAASGFIIPCGQGALRLLRVQRPGRPPVSGEDYLRGIAGKGAG